MKTLSAIEPGPLTTTVIVAGLLALFAIVSFTAVLGKSAAMDEPLHAVGGMVHRDLHDFRINPEDPPLLGWWASLPHRRGALRLDTAAPAYQRAVSDDGIQWKFVVDTLYTTDAAAAADRFLNQSRIMFLIVGIALGALIARWAYEIGGGFAAVIACGFFAMDPNFLAHSVLIKSDVPMALIVLTMSYCVWRSGKNGRWYWLAAAVVVAALAVNVKLTGIFCVPILLAILFFRSFLPEPWHIGRAIVKLPMRLAVVGTASIASLVLIWLFTWAAYGFRYGATSDGKPLNSAAFVGRAGERANSIPIRLDLWMQTHHVLPEGWLYAILAQYVASGSLPSFLLGQVTSTGHWYYFPLAILFKTPTATLLAIVSIPPLLRWLGPRKKLVREPSAASNFDRVWLPVCLVAAPAIFLSIAMLSNDNIGLRHILTIYPFIFVAVGAGASAIIRRSHRLGMALSGVLLLCLFTESLAAYPNYVAFFNAPSGASAGGVRLLGDSNLDWGQDLPALARWCDAHPDRKLYLCYFGISNPSAYGLRYVNLPGGWPFAPVADFTGEPGVLAMSATNVQGIYFSPELSAYYAQRLRGEKPFEVLNGTIYLYNWPPR